MEVFNQQIEGILNNKDLLEKNLIFANKEQIVNEVNKNEYLMYNEKRFGVDNGEILFGDNKVLSPTEFISGKNFTKFGTTTKVIPLEELKNAKNNC